MTNEFLSRLGFGEKIRYVMLFQSIITMVAVIITSYALLNSIISNNFTIYTIHSHVFPSTCFDGFMQILYCVMALMLLFYTLYFSYKGKDNYFLVIMSFYSVCIFRFAMFQPSPINILRIIQLFCLVLFMYYVVDVENFKIAKKLMLVNLVLVIICNIITSYMGGALIPTFEVTIVQISISFTFFVRFLKNKNPEIAM